MMHMQAPHVPSIESTTPGAKIFKAEMAGKGKINDMDIRTTLGADGLATSVDMGGDRMMHSVQFND